MFQRIHLRSIVPVLCVLLIPFAAIGRSTRQATDSLQRAAAEQRLLLHKADSAEDVPMAIAVRLHLSTLVKPREAIRILEEGAALAQSTDRLMDEIATRTYLSQAYAKVKDHRKAHVQAMQVIALDHVRYLKEAERSAARTDSLLAAAKEAHRATIRADMLRQLEVEEAATRQQDLRKRWMVIALLVAVVAVLVVVVLLLRTGRLVRKARSEMALLRAEVAASKIVPANRVRSPEQVIQRESKWEEPPVVAETTVPVDETVTAMFRKRIPERLSTLREARGRGDHEKVVRVVHTLKPQLVATDETLAELCAAITRPAAHAEELKWNTDLDRLEAAIEARLRG
ncbi:MAG: Hpt domain-containing protein [Flavobacteriales bacterium]|jgi:hypothetical protein|nr:Hpt domain-containing protein [Flavobacteriales bacterium]MBK6550584.1 Hpt domain-containing protein [Flavobacteriales bacterium]MBK6884811.1 Hpt domain-containing protein [Flavobacteriales bacterium]MBK7112603.1 Hpt domain-containing protein [Flavobacteriales bacterium]MBK7483443.1 Hpt domain-containing protein [Flavobacteriales bacterium]